MENLIKQSFKIKYESNHENIEGDIKHNEEYLDVECQRRLSQVQELFHKVSMGIVHFYSFNDEIRIFYKILQFPSVILLVFEISI